MTIDLQDLPIVDHHCHAFFRPDSSLGIDHFMKIFTESDFPEILHQHIPHTLYYRKAMRSLAAFFSCEPTPAGVLEARSRYTEKELLHRLFADAGIETVLFDTGFPPGTYTPDELKALLPCKIGRILRLEQVAGELVPQCSSFSELVDRLSETVRAFASTGGKALKSIIAYRSGLAVVPPEPSAVESGFRHLLQRSEGRAVRIAEKAVLDALLLHILEINRELTLPVQFHTGFGDRDIDLLQANPLLLKTLFQERKFYEFPIILLHAGYPYIREAGYLVNTYPNLYVDISLSVPLIHQGGIILLGELLELAPSTKVLYASDGHSFPEFHWLGAKFGREIVTQFLSTLCREGLVEEGEAYRIGSQIFHENARRVYKL